MKDKENKQETKNSNDNSKPVENKPVSYGTRASEFEEHKNKNIITFDNIEHR
jgi:hypothetical protein